ncbi:response regulator [Hymenobacter sp.]|uniref:response regulator n=1 Tax=Hymenobacter sp. TaxID=1898978 RepID=UPI00286B704C|nr:response regulator [Hymenobacter sp.]
MNPSFLRVLVAADSAPQAALLEQYLHEAGHEVVTVEARGDAALKAARLLHPDFVVLSGPLRGPLDGVALAAALQAGRAAPIPVVLVTDPAELPVLLRLQDHANPARTAPAEPPPLASAPDAALEEAGV